MLLQIAAGMKPLEQLRTAVAALQPGTWRAVVRGLAEGDVTRRSPVSGRFGARQQRGAIVEETGATAQTAASPHETRAEAPPKGHRRFSQRRPKARPKPGQGTPMR